MLGVEEPLGIFVAPVEFDATLDIEVELQSVEVVKDDDSDVAVSVLAFVEVEP